MTSIHGRCFCKAIEFEIEPPTDYSTHCHCESCRLLHGAPVVTWTSVDRSKFRFIRGEDMLKSYESTPGIFWQFCSKCGASLLYSLDNKPQTIYMTVANLSHMDKKPQTHTAYNEHVNWLSFRDHLPKLTKVYADRYLPDDNGYDFRRYIVLLKNIDGKTPSQKLTEKHVQYLQQLEAKEVLSMAGPFSDNKGGGIIILKAPSLADAITMAKADPFVKENCKDFTVREMEISCEDNAHLGLAKPTDSNI